MKPVVVFLFLLAMRAGTVMGEEPPAFWAGEWPLTDFSQHSVAFDEILSGGPPKDGIPSIDEPRFQQLDTLEAIAESEPVIAVSLDGETRAYPLRILIWHEIVNDRLAGRPIAVTYCPLCNAAIVFDRKLDGRVYEFGTTGKLRNSDLIMYDRQTESWWQQFSGEAIVGELTGMRLKVLPARVESLASLRAREPDAMVLVPNDAALRPYGSNPYRGYDSSGIPFLFKGELPEGIAPLAYVVAVGDQAWPLERLQKEGRLEAGDLLLEWRPGMNSALDASEIAAGRDIGQVLVTKLGQPVPHDVTFSFVFNAFRPEGRINF